MTNEVKAPQPLRVFLCHASVDKPVVRELYGRLVADGIQPWLDERDILPGQDWRYEISRAVKKADAIVVCLSNVSVTREGFVQKEIKDALNVADEKPEGTIFIIPLRLEECPIPDRLGRWHWVNYYEEGGYHRLLQALSHRAENLGAVPPRITA